MAVQGVEHTSVAQIVREARSSVGSFYARFDGKDDFVQHLEGRVWEDARERWDLALERLDVRDLSTPELVAGVVRLLLETSDADLNRRRVLGTASGSTARASAFHDHVLATVAMVLLDRRDEFAHPDPEQAVALGYRVIAGALRELPALAAWTNGAGTESLVSELTRLYLGYLGSDAEPPAPRLAATTGRPPLVATAASTAVPLDVDSAPVDEAPLIDEVPRTEEAARTEGVWRTEDAPIPTAAEQPAEEAPPAPLEPVEEEQPLQEAALAAKAEGEATDLEEPDETSEEPERVDFFDVWG